MDSIMDSIRSRKSVRSFDGQSLRPDDLAKLRAFMENIENPYGQKVNFLLLDAGQEKLSCPVITGTELYVGGKLKPAPHCNEAFGYSFECLVLYARSLGIGTTCIGGTIDRAAFELAMGLEGDELMPCVSPLGYPAEKMSLREALMRKSIRADERRPFEELFFAEDFDIPLTKAAAGPLAAPLEAVRLAPSAVNKQPWRIVLTEQAAHFYLQRARGLGGSLIDMQKIDLGIALCHFSLTARELGMKLQFSLTDPGLEAGPGMEYIATYRYE